MARVTHYENMRKNLRVFSSSPHLAQHKAIVTARWKCGVANESVRGLVPLLWEAIVIDDDDDDESDVIDVCDDWSVNCSTVSFGV